MNKDIFERIRLYKKNFKRIKLQKEQKKVKVKKLKLNTYKKQSKIKIFFRFILGIFTSFFEYFAMKSNKKNLSSNQEKVSKNNVNKVSNQSVKNVKKYEKSDEVVNYKVIKEKEEKITKKVNEDEERYKNAKVELAVLEDQIIYANNTDDLNKVYNRIYSLKGNFNIDELRKNNLLIEEYKNDYNKYNQYDKNSSKEEIKPIEDKVNLNKKNEDQYVKVLKRIDEDVELIKLKKNYIEQEEKLAEQIGKSENEEFIEDDFVKAKKIGALIYNYVNGKDSFDDNVVDFDQDKLIAVQDDSFDKKVVEKIDDNLDKIIEENDNKDSSFDYYVERKVGIPNIEKNEKNDSVEEKGIDNQKEGSKEKKVVKKISAESMARLNDSIDRVNADKRSIKENIDISNRYTDEFLYYLEHPEDALPFVDQLDIMFTRTIQGVVNVGAAIGTAQGRIGALAGATVINRTLERHIRNVHDSGIESNLNSMRQNAVYYMREGKKMCEDSSFRINEIKSFYNSLPSEFKEEKEFKAMMVKCVSIERINSQCYDRINKALNKAENVRVYVNRNTNGNRT